MNEARKLKNYGAPKWSTSLALTGLDQSMIPEKIMIKLIKSKNSPFKGARYMPRNQDVQIIGCEGNKQNANKMIMKLLLCCPNITNFEILKT